MALKLTSCVFLAITFLALETTSKSVNTIDSSTIHSGLIDLPNISGVAGDILNGGKELLYFIIELQDKAKEMYSEQIKKTEQVLIQLQQGVTRLDEKQKTFAAEAMSLLFQVKYTLKITRTSLNQVAQGIVGGMDELTALAETVFKGEIMNEEEINQILIWNVVTAKNMIKDGQEKVEDAQKAYEDIGQKMASIDEKLIQYKLFIDAIVQSEHTAVQQTQISDLKATCATFDTVCIFVDFLAFGACSATADCGGGGLFRISETSIAAIMDNLEYLDTKASIALEVVNEVIENQKSLLKYFTKELNVLNALDTALTYTGLNVDRSKDLFFINIPSLRTHYLESLAKLKQAAQDYLDQPELDN